MIKIIGLYPMTGNGGIASWTKKFLSTFPDKKYEVMDIMQVVFDVMPQVFISHMKKHALL